MAELMACESATSASDVSPDARGFMWARWEPVSPHALLPIGTEVAVDWRSARLEGYRGVIVPAGPPPDEANSVRENILDKNEEKTCSDAPLGSRARQNVRLFETGMIVNVARRYLKPVLPAGSKPMVVVVFSTEEYRQLARSQLSSGDAAVEVGSCHGETTDVLRQRTMGRAVGIDISDKVVEKARNRFPECRFEIFDVLGGGDCSAMLPSPSTAVAQAAGRDVPRVAAFVDINGERAAGAVFSAVLWAQSLQAVFKPDFICVKSQQLLELMPVPSDAPIIYSQFRLVPAPRASDIYPAMAPAPAIRGPRKEAHFGARWYEKVGMEVPAAHRSLLKGGHPLKYPPRRSKLSGRVICRHFNYGVCFKADACSYDHSTCHHCGTDGHPAKNCPEILMRSEQDACVESTC